MVKRKKEAKKAMLLAELEQLHGSSHSTAKGPLLHQRLLRDSGRLLHLTPQVSTRITDHDQDSH